MAQATGELAVNEKSGRQGLVERLLAGAAAALATGTLMGAAALATGGAASAPEPAQLTQSLYGSTGASAAAVYTVSQTNTSVVRWPTNYSSVTPSPAVGTPCSPYQLASYETTDKVIVGSGPYRKCS